jgi:hypothetical protein
MPLSTARSQQGDIKVSASIFRLGLPLSGMLLTVSMLGSSCQTIWENNHILNAKEWEEIKTNIQKPMTPREEAQFQKHLEMIVDAFVPPVWKWVDLDWIDLSWF